MKTVLRVILANRDLPESSILIRKKGSRRPKKMSQSTNRLLKCTALKNPMMAAKEIKEVMFLELGNVLVRTIEHHLQKELKLLSRSAAMKALIMDKMRKERVDFSKKFKHWTPDHWGKVVFSAESTFKMLPASSGRWCAGLSAPTVQLPLHGQDNEAPCQHDGVGSFFMGDVGREGLYFLSKNVTMNGEP